METLVKLFNLYTKQEAYENTKLACAMWLRDQNPIMRCWHKDGLYYYDVGIVYYSYENIFKK